MNHVNNETHNPLTDTRISVRCYQQTLIYVYVTLRLWKLKDVSLHIASVTYHCGITVDKACKFYTLYRMLPLRELHYRKGGRKWC